MTDKQITEDGFEILKLSRPDAHIEVIGGQEYVVFAEYDINTDTSSTQKRKLVRSERAKPTVGTKDYGTVRTGRVAAWFKERWYKRPDGKGFRIVDPPKDD